jgi:hypothetical protein
VKGLRREEEVRQKDSHTIQNLKIEEDISVTEGNGNALKRKRGRPSLNSKFKFQNSDVEKAKSPEVKFDEKSTLVIASQRNES